MTPEQPCIPGLFGIRRHKFVARYDRVMDQELVARVSTLEGTTLDRMFGHDVYVRDVCTRCGLTIERTDKLCPKQ